jgi:hypothetical protein
MDHINIPNQKFEGQSEYNSKFVSECDGLPVHHISKNDRLQASLRNTNLDLSLYVEKEKPRSPPRDRATHPQFLTESTDCFHWPPSSALRQAQRSTAKQSSVSQAAVLPGAAIERALVSRSSLPLTESQSKFSWPDAAQLVQHTPHQQSPKQKKKLAKNYSVSLQNGLKKYSIMRGSTNSHYPSGLFASSQQIVPGPAAYQPNRGQTSGDDNFQVPQELLLDGRKSFAGTTMSQDSLSPPDARHTSKVSMSPVSVADPVDSKRYVLFCLSLLLLFPMVRRLWRTNVCCVATYQ